MFRHRELVGLTTQVGWADKMANLLVLCSSDFGCQFWADSAQNRCQYRIAKCLANCANLSSIKVLRNNLCFVRSADPLNEQLKSTYKHRLIQNRYTEFLTSNGAELGGFHGRVIYTIILTYIYIYIISWLSHPSVYDSSSHSRRGSTMMAAIISFLGPLDAEERQSWLNRHGFFMTFASSKVNKKTWFGARWVGTGILGVQPRVTIAFIRGSQESKPPT